MESDKMYCRKCGTENEEDALFCKKCGTNLIEEYEKELEEEKKKKPKEKKKTKVKKKVKKKKGKPSRRKVKEKEVIRERKMGPFAKLIMFLLLLFVLSLAIVCGGLGYKIYSDGNIEVPNVTTMTYEEAKSTLLEKNLNIEKQEKMVEEEEQVGIVLKQNKKPGKKVSKNAIIKVIVGVLDDSIVVPNVVGMEFDQAKNTLNHLKISYSVSYKEVEDGEDRIVLSQSKKKGSKIRESDKILLTVSKKITPSPNLSEEDTEEGIKEEEEIE